MDLVIGAFVVAVMVLPFILVGAGGWLLHQRATGEQVQAEVRSCELSRVGRKTYTEYCTARWTTDGRVHVGRISDPGFRAEGKTITATVRGDQLYGRSLATPLVLIGLGLPLFTFPVMMVRHRLRRRRA